MAEGGLTDEQYNLIKPMVKMRIDAFLVLFPTPEDQAAMEAACGEKGEEALGAEFAATFKAADTNQDDVLSKAEYFDYLQKDAGNQKALFGKATDWTEAQAGEQWELLNKLTPGADGVSQADI